MENRPQYIEDKPQEINTERREMVDIPEILEAEHLDLVPLKMEDAQDIFNNFDSNYMLTGRCSDVGQQQRILELIISHFKMGREYVFSIRSKEDEFLGEIGLHEGRLPHKEATPTLSIWLKEEAQRQGFGHEAAETLISWAQDNLDLKYIDYPVDEKNIPSQKFVESLGGVFIGTKPGEFEGQVMKVYHIETPDKAL